MSPEAVEIINIISMCFKFNVLPKAGGLFDQDYLFVIFLTKTMEWQAQKDELDAAKTKANAKAIG